MVITEVYRDVQPGYLITLPARYFLEVNAGELERIDSGSQASFELLASGSLAEASKNPKGRVPRAMPVGE